MLDKAEYSAFESTLNSYRIVGYRQGDGCKWSRESKSLRLISSRYILWYFDPAHLLGSHVNSLWRNSKYHAQTSIALCTARRGYAIPLSIPHRHFLQASGDYRAFFNAQWRTKCAVINWKCVVTKGCSCSDKTIYQSKEMFKFKDLYRAQRLFMDTVHLLIYETCILYNYMTAFITQQLL